MANPVGNPAWYKGMPAANPGGKMKGNIFTQQVLVNMASEFLNTMTGKEIAALVLDKKRFNDMTMAQQLVLRRITEAMRCDSEGRLNFAEVMDRLIGKPKQSIESEMKITLEQLVMGSIVDATPAPLIESQPVPETIDIDSVI